ncbi:MAG: hypothetical protein OEW69_12025, partial [Nitrospirota bacterium]|nr:hypothetical protein [Nitrospirota bacterium]
ERSYNSLNDLEKKVSKQANPSASIWLHDYCSALSEMVTEQCNISRKVIKYNDYCPVRFRK